MLAYLKHTKRFAASRQILQPEQLGCSRVAGLMLVQMSLQLEAHKLVSTERPAAPAVDVGLVPSCPGAMRLHVLPLPHQYMLEAHKLVSTERPAAPAVDVGLVPSCPGARPLHVLPLPHQYMLEAFITKVPTMLVPSIGQGHNALG